MEDFDTVSDSPAAEGNTAPEMVPVSALQGIREELNMLKDKNSILEAALSDARRAVQTQAKPAGHDNVLPGVEDDDILTAGQVKKIVGDARMEVGMTLALNAVTGLPEFQEVFNTYWPKAYAKDPSLIQEFNEMTSPVARAKFAMRMGKMTQEYKEQKIKPDATEPKHNPDKPHSPRAAGAATLPKSEDADYIQGMSDDDFDKYRAKKRARG